MEDNDDETAPLVQSQGIRVNSEDPADVHQMEFSAQEEEPPPYTSYDEKSVIPPPYYHARAVTPTPSEGSSGASSLIPHINCRVCQTVLSVEGKLHLHVIKCHSCGEATPIRPAPTGKKYVRCPCNCLLICRATSQRIVCPRPNCKRVISLGPISVTHLNQDDPRHQGNPTRRIICAHCHTSFLWVHPEDSYDECPHCKEYSSFGPGFRRRRLRFFIWCGLTMIVIASIVMGVLLHYHETDGLPQMYYICFGALYFIAFILLLFAIRYSCMSVSIIERRPRLQYT